MSFPIAILLAVSAQAAPVAPAVSPPPSIAVEQMGGDEIVVTAQRLKRFRASIQSDRKTGSTQCNIKRSSGDAAFDARVCAVMIACHGEIGQSASIRALEKSRAKKRDIARAWETEANLCMSRSFEKEFGAANPS